MAAVSRPKASPHDDDIEYFSRTRRSYAQAFGTPSGKYVLSDLAAFCGAMNPTYVRGDPHQTAHNEGARSVILRIYSFLRMTADDANTMHDRQARCVMPFGEDE